MTECVYNQDLQQKLRDYCAEVGSQEKAAKMIGPSGAVISMYLKGNYHEKGGDVSKVESRLREFFRIEEEAAARYIVKGYAPTSISEDTYETIKICHLKGRMVNIVGDPGIGKTMGARKYLRDHPHDAVMITVNPCFASVTACLRRLCKALRADPPRRQDAMWETIEDKLRGGRKVIIIDEAQHLPVKTIDTLRAYVDDDNSEIGIALVGNIEIINKRQSASGFTKEQYRQIKSRTRYTEIRHTYDLTLEDILLVFPNLSEKEAGLMLSIAQSDQGIRGAIHTMELAVDNEDTSYDGLYAAADAVGALRFGQVG